MPATAVTARPNASKEGRFPCGGGLRAALTMPITAASAVLSVTKKLLAPFRRAV